MDRLAEQLYRAQSLAEVVSLIDQMVARLGAGQATADDCADFLRALLLNPAMAAAQTTGQAVEHLLRQVPAAAWMERVAPAAARALPQLLAALVDERLDVSHALLLRVVPKDSPAPLAAALAALEAALQLHQGSARYLRGMRAARIMVDVYSELAHDPQTVPSVCLAPSCIDDEHIAGLKQAGSVAQLPAAYAARINQLQRLDLKESLASLQDAPAAAPHMDPDDYERTFVVRAPLRLGISSANASDNHMRSKERGARTLNAGIDLQPADGESVEPPLRVTARRLPEPKLVLRSLSLAFRAEFAASRAGDARAHSERFFAYRRGGDEALRLVKQALVHTGIVRDDSDDIVGDVTVFTGGGGLEIATESRVLQGSGLGTSSILAAAILKALYRLCRHRYATAEGEYPALYDQSLLLEQSIGLNSGWQDARGACGGPSAIKDFYAPPTDGLPAPQRTFLAEVDEATFTERVVLFDTGIARAATRGLNVVLDAYLTRDPERFPAIAASMRIHDHMVAALRAGDYEALGELATRYWQLRCTLDPQATNPTLQTLFVDPALVEVSAGGLITGAGGGGFALLIARAGRGEELRARLRELRGTAAFASSRVVAYRLDRRGIQLAE